MDRVITKFDCAGNVSRGLNMKKTSDNSLFDDKLNTPLDDHCFYLSGIFVLLEREDFHKSVLEWNSNFYFPK